MPGRVDADLLLVGSVPAGSAEEAFRAGAAHFGDLVFALPDGETGPRSTWVGYERETLVRPNPAVSVVAETTSPTGFPRHTYESPAFRLRPGASAVTFGSWPRIDDAIASYAIFASLRESGVIPRGLRFQVGLPFPVSALNGLRADFAADYPVAFRGFTGLVEREMARLLAAIPAQDLAIQWDIAFETLDIEGVVPWTPHEGGWERFAAAVDALPRLIPDEVLVGYHLCYGTNPEWPMYEARDMAVLVRMASYAYAASGRPMDWVHMAGPRLLRSEDERFFRPLADLSIGAARVFLGIVLPVDGELGLRRREATARKFLPDFGVALYCGFRVPPGLTPQQAIQEHEDVVRAVRGLDFPCSDVFGCVVRSAAIGAPALETLAGDVHVAAGVVDIAAGLDVLGYRSVTSQEARPGAGGADRERPRAYDRFVSLRGYDFHVHLPTPDWLDGSMAGYVEAAEAYFRGKVERQPLSQLADKYRQLEIKAVLLAWDAETQTGRPRVPNETVARACREFPDAFCGLGSVDPRKGQAAVDEVAGVAELGLRGVKFHPSLQGFAPDDERYWPVFEACERNGLLALFHTGTSGIGARQPGGQGIRIDLAHPLKLDPVAAAFPGLTVVAAHFGWPWHMDLIAMALHKTNVYIDISGWSPRRIPAEVVRELRGRLSDQFIWGSDFPFLAPERCLAELGDLDLPEAAVSKLLHDNAARVLGLTGK